MKYIYFLFLLIICSCTKDNLHIQPPDPVQEPFNLSNGLGKKLENPYAVRNIKIALTHLQSKHGTSALAPELKPTHLLVRFLPKTYEDMLLLEADSTLYYDSVPYGYENSADLSYYQDPSIPKDQYTWQYAIVDYDYIFPQVHYEVLEELYRPQDEEDELEALAYKVTRNHFNRSGLAGFMFTDDNKIAGIFSKRYRPSGRILVENSFGGSEPLKRAAIQVRTIWWSNVVNTDDNGSYSVDRRYKDIPTVRLWNRNYTNKTTQRWTEHIGFWISDKLGKGKNFNYTISYTEGSKRDLWVKATINNAFVIYDDFANRHGIKRPDHVRTWILSGKDYGGAPLLHNKAITAYSLYYPAIAHENKENFGSHLGKTGIFALSPIIDLIAGVTRIHKNLPDIVIGTKGRNTSEIYAHVFHETAHYSHKTNQLSDAYWAQVQYQAMFDETAGTYGDGSSTYAKYTGVAEAWSHFIEYQLMQQIGLLGKERYAILMTAYTQSSSPSTIPSTDGDGANLACWIPSGLFRDLISKESREVELKDGKNYSTTLLSSVTPVVGFTYSQLYRFLTNDVRSVTDLKNKIIQYYPHKNTNHEITRLFQLYGY